MNVVARKDFIKKLKKLGFAGPFSGGKHQFMARGSLKLRIPNPHGISDISIPLIKEILRQADISWEEFNKV